MTDPARNRFQATGPDAIRRVRHRLRLQLGLLILAAIWGRQAVAEPPDTQEPPPFERLVPPAAEQPDLDAKLFCRKHGGSCADNLSLDGARLYRRVRKWWRPPDNTIITTVVWFGGDARAAAADGAEADTITVVLQLDPGGGLRGSPRTMQPDRIGLAATVVEDLLRAIEKAQPYEMFPPTEFERWKDVLLRIRIEPRSVGDISPR